MIDETNSGETETETVTAETTDGDQQAAPETADEVKTETEAEATEPDDQELTSEKDEAKRRRKLSAQERIAQLTRKLRDSERDVERLKARSEKNRDRSKDPDPASYDDLDRYNADVAVSAAAKARLAEIEDEAAEAAETAAQIRLETWQEKVTEFEVEAPDFATVVNNPNLSITPSMAHILTDADNGPAIAYYLGKHPSEARQIAHLSEREQAIAIGRIDGRLMQQPARRVTKAPDPVQTVSGKSPGVLNDPRKMSMQEYSAWRAGQRKAQG